MADFNLFGQTITDVDGFSLSDTNGTEHTFVEGAVCPIFTVNIENDTVSSITCNKTFQECSSLYYQSANYAVITAQNNQDGVYYQTAKITGVGNALTYTTYDATGPIADIVYNSNGTIEYVSPSRYRLTLTATENGTSG